MSEPTRSADEDASRTDGAARVGKRLGVALFWLMALHIIGTATVSVVGQLDPAPRPPASATEQRCALKLSALHRELTQQGIGGTEDSAQDSSTVQPRLATWDTRWRATEGQCGRLEAVRHHLRAARMELGTWLDDYRNRQQPQLRRIARTLEPFTASP